VSLPIRINLCSVLKKIRYTRTVAKEIQICLYDPTEVYSRSPKNPALQQFQECSKSASAGS